MTDVTPRADTRLVLHRHHLSHLAELQVARNLFECRFADGCNTAQCQGICCSSGAWLDIEQRDRILSSADIVVRYMEAGQERDPSRWFEPETVNDPDFESGLAVGTTTSAGACVFLDSRQRCVLQLAESEVTELKPFYCRAFPIVVHKGQLIIDDELCPGEMHCCGTIRDGTLTVLDVCREELEHVLGAAGLSEFRDLARAVNEGRSGEAATA